MYELKLAEAFISNVKVALDKRASYLKKEMLALDY
jgi:hypothetical protein